MEDKEKMDRLREKALEELKFSEKAYLLQLLTLTHTLVEPLKREEAAVYKLPNSTRLGNLLTTPTQLGLKGTDFWTMLTFLRPIVDITKKLVYGPASNHR